jgi:aminoglycoside 3-N-acetyltransferase
MTPSELVTDLRDAGVRSGLILTVHGSLSSIGQVEGGALSVVAALVDAVGPDGTLLFPALTFSGSMTRFLQETDTVDLRHAPVTTGAIPRAAASHPQAVWSTHPTHPTIAIGPAAQALFSGQQSGQGPCGVDSPFYRAAMAGGYILLIGVTNAVNTTLHCVEEIAAPYMNDNGMFKVRTIDRSGNSLDIRVKGYPVGLSRQFDAINDRLVQDRIMTCHHLGQAKLCLIDGRRMIEFVAAQLVEEPYLLCDSAGASRLKGIHP